MTEKVKKLKGLEIVPLVIRDKDKCKSRISEYDFGNIFLFSMKGSGKTTVINKLIECTIEDNPDDEISMYFFVSTINRDPTYLEIIKRLKKIENVKELYTYTNIIEEKKGEKINILKYIINELEKENPVDLEEKKIDTSKNLREVFIKNPLSKKGKDKKEKVINKRNIFVFDDISNELNNPYVNKLIKENRHLKSSVFIASQNFQDLSPSARSNINVFIFFKNIIERNLKDVYKYLGTNIPYEHFYNLYKKITTDENHPYNFLFYDRDSSKYRINLNIPLNIK